jgi:quercetin dioxygenase-like cupin family protein
MKRLSLLAVLSAAVLAAAAPCHADSHGASPNAAAGVKAPVTVRPVLSTTTTASGQPIVLPQKDAQVIVSTYEIAPGAVLPVHKHPFPRYALVQAGLLRVTNADTGKSDDYKPGDFIVEVVDQWHYGTNTGPDTVKLLVIDMVEKGQSNTVLKK